jgi:hypothetical protein
MQIVINIEPWMVAIPTVMLAISTVVNIWHGIVVRKYVNLSN